MRRFAVALSLLASTLASSVALADDGAPPPNNVIVVPASSAPVLAPFRSPDGNVRDQVAPTVETRPNAPLLISGGVLLGIGHLAALGAGGYFHFANHSGWMAAPVIGPVITLATRRSPSCDAIA